MSKISAIKIGMKNRKKLNGTKAMGAVEETEESKEYSRSSEISTLGMKADNSKFQSISCSMDMV